MNAMRTLLVPLDRSPLSRRVMDVAIWMAVRFDANIVVLRVSKSIVHVGVPDVAERELQAVEDRTRHLLAEALACLADHRLDPARIHAEVRSGPLVRVIKEAAAEHLADMVILGTHGRGVRGLFSSSTIDRVVARLPISVMVVKADGYPYLQD